LLVEDDQRNGIENSDFFISLLTKIQLKILCETITKPINCRYSPLLSKHDCPCYGPLQVIFVVIAWGVSAKSGMELGTLTLNRIDNSHLLRFLSKLPFLLFSKDKPYKPEERRRK
jgi:hypothetical protein